jgi:hypothetical protein
VSRCQQFDLAIDDYSATIAITTHPARAFAFRTDDLTDFGRDDEARRDYESSSRIAPDDLHPRFGRMRFRFYQRNYSKSIQDANVWLELVYLDSSEDGEQQPYVLALQHMSSQRPGISDYENLAADASHLDANVWLELIHLYSSEDGEEQPYVLALQHMSSQRLGISDDENLAADASHLDHYTWPYPVIAYYLGQIDRIQLLTAADSGDRIELLCRQCEAYAYMGKV